MNTHTIITMLIGYAFGCIQSAFLISKFVGKMDIREFGSGNAGASNITFGTDTPYGKQNLKKNIDRIKSLDISSKEKELIFGENMRKLLKI